MSEPTDGKPIEVAFIIVTGPVEYDADGRAMIRWWHVDNPEDVRIVHEPITP